MYRPDRDQIPVVLFILLTIVAIGTIAATINNVSHVDKGRSNIVIEPRGGGSSIDINRSLNNTNGSADFQRGEPVDLSICIPFLTRPIAIIGILAGVGTMMYGIYRRFNAATSLLLATGVIPIVWLSYFVTTNCAGGTSGGSGMLFDSSSVISNKGGLSTMPVPPTVVAGLFGVVMVVGIAVVLTTTDEDETFEPIEDEPDSTDFAAAAGRAADRIEEMDVAVDNAVYRAWLEMTDLLDLENPESTAPRDFAIAAIDAGLDQDDVWELTELFNEVRYGGEDPNTRESKAIEILRNIEETYQNETTGGENE